MQAIVRWTIQQRRWSVFWWSLGIVALVTMTLAFYPSVHDQASQLDKSLGNLSNSTLALFGGTDFFSPVGYLNSQLIYLMFPLVLAILGIGLGSSLIGREEHDSTIEVLLARPVPRGRLLAAKALAGACILFVVAGFGTVATLALAKAVNLGVPLGNIAAACFACFMLVVTFSSVAFLLAATGRGRGAAIGVATTYAFGGYIIASLATTVSWLKHVSIVFPYHYYDSAAILRGTFSWGDILFFACFIVAASVLSWLAFRRRDLS